MRKLTKAGENLSEHLPLDVRVGLCTGNRDRASTCRKCMDSCPAGILKKEDRGVQDDIAADRCARCGLCATVCPVGVFEAKDPSDEEIIVSSAEVLERFPEVVFVCSHRLGRTRIPYAVEVPCVGRLNEAVLVGAAAMGAEKVWLECSARSTCGIGQGAKVAAEVLKVSRRILSLYEHPTEIALTSRQPVVHERKNERSRQSGSKRRELRKQLKEVAESSRSETETMRPDSQLCYHLPKRRRLLLHFMRALGKPVKEKVPAGEMPFAQVHINENCSICNWCTLFCPTGALAQRESGGRGSICFDPAHCVKCGLCEAVCQERALTLEEEIAPAKLMSGEEALVEFGVYKCEKCLSKFGTHSPKTLCLFCEREQRILGIIQ